MEMWLDNTGASNKGVHRKRSQGRAKDDVGIDLTPMLDVVMIMLIFFIVTGSFVREITVDVERKPASTSQSDQPSDNINIQISADGQIWIKGRRIDVTAVRANISRLKAENPKAAVVITAARKSLIDVVAQVIDASREAGIYSVSLSTAG